jgi:uncharacterized alpha-E superfamily protein
MLSRVADSLFWMSRYLERAEAAARLLDSTLLLDLDLSGVSEQRSADAHLRAALKVLHQKLPEGHSGPIAVCRWAGFESKNPLSVLAYITRTRNNARGIRGSLNPVVWRAINTLYLQLSDPDIILRASESPHEFFTFVEAGSHYVQGVCDNTLPHDEGWHFIQIGKFFERADNTIRILETALRLLLSVKDVDQTLQTLEWAAVLRACRAYDGYLQKHVTRVDPKNVVTFLLHDELFPRSVRFCLEQVQLSLKAIERISPTRDDGLVDRLLGRLLADFRFAEPPAIDTTLADQLKQYVDLCNAVSRGVQRRYALVA